MNKVLFLAVLGLAVLGFSECTPLGGISRYFPTRDADHLTSAVDQSKREDDEGNINKRDFNLNYQNKQFRTYSVRDVDHSKRDEDDAHVNKRSTGSSFKIAMQQISPFRRVRDADHVKRYFTPPVAFFTNV